MTQELLNKFLNNTCSEEELDEIIKWIKTNSFDGKTKNWILDDWTNSTESNVIIDDKRFSELFDKIQEKIDLNKQTNSKESNNPVILKSYTNWITKAAAVLLIPVLSFLFYTLHEKRIDSARYADLMTDSLEVIAPTGSRTIVHLSDGSEVQLNYGSKIKYPRYFTGATRDVVLNGEAFFQVAHNPKQPFIVKAGKLNIVAVGTTFNILAYPDDDVIETTLVDGKVILKKKENNGRTKTINTMIPGQHAVYKLQTGTLHSSSGNIKKYYAWTEGKLIFVDTPITKIAEKLNRMFNVDIKIQDNVKDLYYTFTLVDEPLYQILDFMTVATPVVTYKVIPRTKLPDGSFSKQKIIISKRIK